GQVHHRHHAADGGGELHQSVLRQFLRRQRLVGRTEVDGAGLDLGDAAAGADRLVVDLVAGGLVVVGRPLGDQRIDEAGAGAGDFHGDRVAGGGRGVGRGGVGAGGGRGFPGAGGQGQGQAQAE